MSIIQVKTSDPNFGFIIRKNPASGMQLKPIRKGMSFGWYSQNNTAFNIFFKDADNEVSFGNQEFEYLNTDRYNSPLFILSAISEFFNSTVKAQCDEDITVIEKSFFINMLDIKSIHQISNFKRFFNGFDIDCQHYVAKSYKITITTEHSFYMLFNYVNLLMMFIALTNDEFIYLETESIEKYLCSIERLDAPFFIRYLFNRNLLTSKKQFEKYKERLETSKLYQSIILDYGNTAQQRMNNIRKKLLFNNSILDIGCGEGFYAIPFAKNLPDDKQYHAIDIVEELTDKVLKKANKKEIENILIYNHIDEFLETYDGEQMDIILTEVIEHMPKIESGKLIQKIINNINIDKFIITVPNIEFNQFYMLYDELRHEDHDWEPTKNEFQDWMINEIPVTYNVEFINIGDTVNGISTSIGCVITSK